jgi:flavin-dependent dehydrogenase
VDGSKIGTPASMEVDMVIGADGANSRVAKEIDAGEYDYAIAFQERIRIPGECEIRGGLSYGFAAVVLLPGCVTHYLGGVQRGIVSGCVGTLFQATMQMYRFVQLVHDNHACAVLCCAADDKMKYYENLAEMYVGDDVSPDFYGWVFPKYDHVAVGTGAACNTWLETQSSCFSYVTSKG